jgi:hypothetical protein
MGKTVPAYRWVLEEEINNWKGFRNALVNDDSKAAFDELMDMCRSFASAGGCATNPIVFEPMVMSMLLAQQVRIQKLERQLKESSEKSGETSYG